MADTWKPYDRGGMGWDIDGVQQGIRGAFLNMADAEMAATAPELLAIVEIVARAHAWNCAQLFHPDNPCECQYYRARAAIAHAKGETHDHADFCNCHICISSKG